MFNNGNDLELFTEEKNTLLPGGRFTVCSSFVYNLQISTNFLQRTF
jgi:hypothetical protein